MKKTLLLLMILTGVSCFGQRNPSYFRFGVYTNFIQLDTLTTAERDALTIPSNTSSIVYNSSVDSVQYKIPNGAWKSFGSGDGITNLSTVLSPTTVTILSDTGSDAPIPLADGTNAGLTENNYTDSDKEKVDYIDVTEAVDLDKVFDIYTDSPIVPIFWAGTQAEHDAKFGASYVHPNTDFIIITDGASPTLNADDINVDDSAFGGNLEIGDDDLQKVANKVDALVLGSNSEKSIRFGGRYSFDNTGEWLTTNYRDGIMSEFIDANATYTARGTGSVPVYIYQERSIVTLPTNATVTKIQIYGLLSTSEIGDLEITVSAIGDNLTTVTSGTIDEVVILTPTTLGIDSTTASKFVEVDFTDYVLTKRKAIVYAIRPTGNLTGGARDAYLDIEIFYTLP